jgi:hypothetical protein
MPKRVAITLLLCSLCPGATVLRIACGGPGGTDPAGNVWAPDAGYTGGAAWTAANQAALASQPVPYRTLRYSSPPGAPFGYLLTLPPTSTGQYVVTLKFTEPNKTGPGLRIFSVSLNGAPAISNLDLFAAAPGALVPLDRSFPLTTTTGLLQISLTASVGNAVLSGIQVDTVDAVVPDGAVTFVKGLESAPPPCPATGLGIFLATDTFHLFWCSTAGDSIWHTVGDVRNATPIAGVAPQVLVLESCNGSGAGWNCAGIWHAKIGIGDGSVVSICGPDMVVPYGSFGWTQWYPAK